MGYFYIDDSVHDNAGFILGACVYSEIDLTEKVDEVTVALGFDPSVLEFKSRINFSKEPEKAKLREQFKELVHSYCRLGIVVIPRSEREKLGTECIKAIKQFTDFNSVKKPTHIYLDQGLFPSKNEAQKFADTYHFNGIEFHFEQDSKIIKGIQIADLCAHIASIQFKGELGLLNKKVKAGGNSGYDPDLEIELHLEMWAILRYIFFNEGSKQLADDVIESSTLLVEPYGLYVSNLCNDELRLKIRETFSTVYLGCIH